MKTSSFITVLFVLLSLVACEDNFDRTEITTELSESTELESIVISGKVSDSAALPISDAQVAVQLSDQQFTVSTDAEGNYELALPPIYDQAFLQVQAENYVTSAITPVELDSGSLQQDITIKQEAELTYTGEVLLLQGSSLATISGQVFWADGSPAAFAILLLIDFKNIFTMDPVFTYITADEEGKYLFAHEPFNDYNFLVQNRCIGESNFIEQNLSLGDESIDLGAFNSDLEPVKFVFLSGFVTDCNTGTGLSEGTVRITIDEDLQTRMETSIVDGSYLIDFVNCDAFTCMDIEIFSSTDQSYNKIDCVPLGETSITVDHTLCGDDRNLEGEIRMKLGADSLIYFNAFASNVFPELEENWLIGSVDIDGTTGVVINSACKEVGTHGITFFAILEDGDIVYGTDDSSDVEFVVSRIDDYIEGSFSGLLLDTLDQSIPVSGTYRINL